MRPPARRTPVVLLLIIAIAALSLTAAAASASSGHRGPHAKVKVPKLKPVHKVVKVKSTKKPPKNVKFRGQPMPGGITTGSGTTTDGTGGVLVAGVPGYLWRDGCGPTAVGMVIGYWDGNGWPDLISGDATSQTTYADEAISSSGSFNDYALPQETSSTILTDKSQTGGAHTSNCAADFMHTSWSADGLPYGWSYSNMVGPSFKGYVATKYPTATISTGSYAGTALTWTVVKNEIDAGRPMVFLVDASGDGMTDHFVTIVGYRESNGYAEYGCWDTWSGTLVRWQRFRAMSTSYDWGVWGGFKFSISGTQTPTPTPTPTTTPTPTPSIVDTTAPVTSAAGLDSSWHNSSVTVSFSASDSESGVAYSAYSLDGGALVRGTSFTIAVSKKTPTAAVHTVRYFSADNAGNVETAHLGQVKIDSIKPSTTSNADGLVHTGSFTLVLSPQDAHSGVSSSYVSVDGGAYKAATSVTISGSGRHSVKFYSKDNAGNVETAKSVAVRIG